MIRLPVKYAPPQQHYRNMPMPRYALGQTFLSDKAVPFIFGMITWAFLGDTIKDTIGLGQSAARRGISVAKAKIEKKK